MTWLDLREPVSAWTHGAWALGALPAGLLVWRICRGDRVKQLSMLLFCVTLFLCFGGSMLYHGVRLSEKGIEVCRKIDHVGIYLLIAGTVTPPAVVVMRGGWRRATLLFAWGMAAFGISMLAVWPVAPLWTCTLTYVAIGWGVCLGYFELARTLPPGALKPVWLGGLLYSIGAALNVAEWPRLVPGVFGTHELWHLFGIAGSACHFWFMIRWVAPFERGRTVAASPVRASIQPAAVLN
ncbi:MAG TPA: hemolysin III family protein [Gemmataceae bacterium]|nr:hemolysin III family protein [Gemmataceae bacterium]